MDSAGEVEFGGAAAEVGFERTGAEEEANGPSGGAVGERLRGDRGGLCRGRGGRCSRREMEFRFLIFDFRLPEVQRAALRHGIGRRSMGAEE